MRKKLLRTRPPMMSDSAKSSTVIGSTTKVVHEAVTVNSNANKIPARTHVLTPTPLARKKRLKATRPMSISTRSVSVAAARSPIPRLFPPLVWLTETRLVKIGVDAEQKDRKMIVLDCIHRYFLQV